ncbi:MAG TPA: ferric reductase-like transmembrane domain-containing protein [Candidatus Saccharimonadales bacterium]|nr:ferric reductase-like transmembrane domain-containing protein [Candidatus Saccharimonadales bacterium]
MAHKTLRNLPNNNRFYILVFSFLLSVGVACLLRSTIASNQLFYIRLEQAYGFISIALLYTALIIAPLKRVIGGTHLWMQNLEFGRRAIGVAAAYFALLHAGIALWGQIGGLGGVGLLPGRFVMALTLGLVALVVLFLMAITSFDKVIAFMTFRRWKWLHRFVYAGGILIILHVWIIGTHSAYTWVQLTAFIPISLLFALEAWCTVSKFGLKYPEFKSKDYAITTALTLWAVASLLLFLLPTLVQSYHSKHATHSTNASSGTPHSEGGHE